MRWINGWVFIAEFFVGGVVIMLWLARHNPDLLRERRRSIVQREQKVWDRWLMSAMAVLFYGWYALAGLDGGRLHMAPMPLWLNAIGAILIAESLHGSWRTLRENTFAAPVVKIQAGQYVVATGPYARVRHPMYAAAVLMFIGIPLLLDSALALVIAPLLIVLIAIRAVKEEETLAAELPGYADYRQRVRYRLFRYVW
jgi:protein-S-isoprenylcysteine O-methyltransferase Ste14